MQNNQNPMIPICNHQMCTHVKLPTKSEWLLFSRCKRECLTVSNIPLKWPRAQVQKNKGKKENQYKLNFARTICLWLTLTLAQTDEQHQETIEAPDLISFDGIPSGSIDLSKEWDLLWLNGFLRKAWEVNRSWLEGTYPPSLSSSLLRWSNNVTLGISLRVSFRHMGLTSLRHVGRFKQPVT